MAKIVEANLKRQTEGVLADSERNSRALIGSTGCTLSMTHYVGDRKRAPRKMQQGSGAPSFCWVCNVQLQRAPGKGLGLVYFNLVRDKAGVVHRVHGDKCTRDALNDDCVLEE